MNGNLSGKQLRRIEKIDNIVTDYFEVNAVVNEVLAKDLIPLFIEKGIFFPDQKKDFQVRKLFRDLVAANELTLLKHLVEVRKEVNRNWYFTRAKQTV